MQGVAELAAALRAGTTTATALAETFLARHAATNSLLHSFVCVDPPRLLAEAERADAELRVGRDRGPLHGIPVGIKDIIDVAGFPTQCGSPLYPMTPVDTDAVAVANLRDAGALIWALPVNASASNSLDSALARRLRTRSITRRSASPRSVWWRGAGRADTPGGGISSSMRGSCRRAANMRITNSRVRPSSVPERSVQPASQCPSGASGESVAALSSSICCCHRSSTGSLESRWSTRTAAVNIASPVAPATRRP